MQVLQHPRVTMSEQIWFAVIFAGLALLQAQLQSDHIARALPDFAFGFAAAALLCLGPQFALSLSVCSFGLIVLGLSPLAPFVPPTLDNIAPLSLGLGIILFGQKLPPFTGIDSSRIFLRYVVGGCALLSLINALGLMLSLVQTQEVNSTQLLRHFGLHWLATLNACLLFFPLMNEWRHATLVQSQNQHFGEFNTPSPILTPLLFTLTLVAGQMVFFRWLPAFSQATAAPFWIIFLLSISALRSVGLHVFVLLLLSSLQVIASMYSMRGYFFDTLPMSAQLNSHAYLLAASFTTLLIVYFRRETQNYATAVQATITQLKVKEEALDSISQGVMTTDREHRITYVNKAFRSLTQYDNEDLLGKKYGSLLAGEETSSTAIHLITDAIQRQVGCNVDILCYKKNGERFWNELTITPVFHDQVLQQLVSVHHDISWRIAAAQDASLAQVVFQNNLNAITITDANAHILLVNRMFCEMSGYTQDEVRGQSLHLIASDKHDAAFYQSMWQSINEQGYWSGEITNKRKDGSLCSHQLSISTVRNQQQEITNYIGMYRDLSQEKNAESQIAQLQYKDQLTGLANANALQRQVEENLQSLRAQSEQPAAALLIIDIDHFKYVNDTLNHHIGDQLLIQVAERLSTYMTEGDTLSRQSADEFKLYLPSKSRAQAESLAKRLLQAFRESFTVDEHQLYITVSIGVAIFPDDGQEPEALFRSADIALNQAKSNGKNRFLFHTEEMSQALNERVILEHELLHAVQRNEFQLCYQPLVDIKTGMIDGFEALLRWEHPKLGRISPAKFIAIAEENGYISTIGTWVFNQACHDIREGLNAGINMPAVAINLSPKQFQNRNMLDEVKETLKKYDLQPINLGIEITEGVLMMDPQASQATLTELRDLGFELSLDDFGTGYSSLSYLKTFSFDKVKIDQSFIRGLNAKNQDAAIVIAIINMAHSLGIRVLAEGVENESQCEFLRDNLVDEIQGYMFSKPLPWDETLELLKESRTLPAHLLRFPETTRTLLLVDDEQNIVSALKRLVRKDGYEIHTANSGAEALEILAKHAVDVIISDQRMPNMTGVEFLSKVKELYPDTIRLMLSGYTELTSVTDAINEGSVFRFLTKPWDDEKLRATVKEAFQYKHYADDNHKLSLKAQETSYELAVSNRQLAELIAKKQSQISVHQQSLEIVREALRHTSVALLGLDDTNMVALINDAAIELFSEVNLNFGDELMLVLPDLHELLNQAEENTPTPYRYAGKSLSIRWYHLAGEARSKGKIVTMTAEETSD